MEKKGAKDMYLIMTEYENEQESKTYYYGKDWKLAKGLELTDYFINEYGFEDFLEAQLCLDAHKILNRAENNFGFWNVKSSIIEYIKKGNNYGKN